MKRLILALVLGCAGMASAAVPASDNISSFTTTNDSAAIQAAYLDKVIITKVSATGHMNIFSSTWTSNLNSPGTNSSATVVSSISLATVGTYIFDNTKVRGIYYVILNNVGAVTLIYKK